MSGGSFDYLYCKDIADDGHRGEIVNMARSLDKEGHHEAAFRTYNVAWLLNEAQRLAEELKDIWHAQEYYESGDWGSDCVSKAVDEWKQLATTNTKIVDAHKRLFDLEAYVKSEFVNIANSLYRSTISINIK